MKSHLKSYTNQLKKSIMIIILIIIITIIKIIITTIIIYDSTYHFSTVKQAIDADSLYF